MLNQVILAGRLTQDLEVKELEDGKKVATLIIAVPRSYKNEEGVYDTDFIRCVLWNAIAENVSEYCKKGDVVGVKGRLQTSTYESESGEKHYSMEVIAEKVSFLSSSRKED